MRLQHRCETIFSEPRTMQRRGIMFLLIGVIVLAYWGCGSSNNSESSHVTEGNGSGLRLALQMPSGSDPADIDKFEISVTGPGISLFDTFGLGRHKIGNGTGPFSVALGDVDGDGVLDIVTANNASNDVSILVGLGSGAFFSDQRLFVGGGPFSVALTDVNGKSIDVNQDGLLEIVTANNNENSVTILPIAPSLKNIPNTGQYERVTIGGRDQLVFYLTLEREIPLGPNRTFTVRAFLPGSLTPDFIGSKTQTISRLDTSIVVDLNPTSSSE